MIWPISTQIFYSWYLPRRLSRFWFFSLNHSILPRYKQNWAWFTQESFLYISIGPYPTSGSCERAASQQIKLKFMMNFWRIQNEIFDVSLEKDEVPADFTASDQRTAMIFGRRGMGAVVLVPMCWWGLARCLPLGRCSACGCHSRK